MASTSRVFHATLYRQTIRQARRFVSRVLNEMEIEAEAIASRGQYSTRRLANSIDKVGPIVTGTRVEGSLGSRLPYAAAVEKGAKVHNIFPKGAPHVYRFGRVQAPALKFYWRKADRTVFANQVPMGPGTVGISHPGQKGKGFLIRPLRNAAIRHRMTIIVFDV